MKLPFTKTWLSIEREDYANYLFVAKTWEGWTWRPKQWGFVNGRFIGAEFIDSACNLFIQQEANDHAIDAHFRMFFTDPRRYDWLHRYTEKWARELFKFGKQARRLKVNQLSNRECFRWINRFQELQARVHVPRGVMWLLETPNMKVSQYLYNYLEEQRRDVRSVSETPQQAFQTLTTPLRPSLWAAEREALYRIAAHRDKEKQKQLLGTHSAKYEWLEYGLQGKILDQGYFNSELIKALSLARQGNRRTFAEESRLIKARQQKLIKEYRVGRAHQTVFRIVRDAFWMRQFSKDSQYYGYYAIEPLMREIGRRTRLTLEQIRFLAPDDYRAALLNRKDFRSLTTARQQYSLFVCDRGRTNYFTGARARAVRKMMIFTKTESVEDNAQTLAGQIGFSGQVTGYVKVINTRQEMVKMHKGNVLISHMTNPDIVPAMKLAAAIVTDLGGITCHAAIVARELKVPCVIGTKFATKVFKDGDKVEVDATKGVVRKI